MRPPNQMDGGRILKQSSLVPIEKIQAAIYEIRGEKVMLDRDLASLYEVKTKMLKRAVRRHLDRFPEDFMFVLSRSEFQNWRRQFGTSKSDAMGLRHAPMAFTEHGIVMLSSVLNSKRAIQVNVEIVRAFIRLRQILGSHDELSQRLDELERKYDRQFKIVFDAIRQLTAPPPAQRKQIGFILPPRQPRNADRST
jgi:ORF6N domain